MSPVHQAGKHYTCAPTAVTVKHVCCYLKVEKLARTLFLWKIEVHEQKEKVYEMRRWNEALVTNMLPEHVARHFLGSKKRDEVRSSHPQTPGRPLIQFNSIQFYLYSTKS